jgi:hypothetical protein
VRVGDALYFSPRFKFSELDVENASMILEAFRDRVHGFYLTPASRLLKHSDAFAGGLICCAAVECIAGFAGNEPLDWLCSHIADFGQDRARTKKFWVSFRHGLIHEGRIKSFGQFSLEMPAMLTTIGPAVVVNPRLLLESVEKAFDAYCQQMKGERLSLLVKQVRRYFEPEIVAATLTS